MNNNPIRRPERSERETLDNGKELVADAQGDIVGISRRDALKLAALSPLAGVAANPRAERIEKFKRSHRIFQAYNIDDPAAWIREHFNF